MGFDEKFDSTFRKAKWIYVTRFFVSFYFVNFILHYQKVIALTWLTYVKIGKARIKLKETRAKQLENFRLRQKVLIFYLVIFGY